MQESIEKTSVENDGTEEVEIELEESTVETPESDEPKVVGKSSTKKKKAKAKEKKPKVKPPPRALTLHKQYLIDIRRHAKYLEITDDFWGAPLVIRKTQITVDGLDGNKQRVKAITIAIPFPPEE